MPATMIVLSTMRTATYASPQSFVLPFHDWEEHHRRPDPADHGQDFQERAERDLSVVTTAEDVRPVMVKQRAVEKQSRNREDERADEQPPDDAGSPLV